METSERCAHLHAACLKLDMSRAADYGRRRRKTFLFLFLFFSPFLFSRSSTRQHDYSAGTERENARKHRYKMKPDGRYSAASFQGSLQKVVLLFLCSAPLFLRLFLSVCHLPFSSPPLPVVSTLSVLTYLTWHSLHFSASFSLLF